MGANRPPACEERAFIEIDLNLLRSTGEVRAIGTPIIAPTITTKVPRGKFEIVYTAELFDVMKELGTKKMEVLAYILDNKDGNNCLNMSNIELAKTLQISRPTVTETMKILKSANLVKRKGTVIMISPQLLIKGNQLREAWLMRKYEEIDEKSYEMQKDAIEVKIDNQLSFTQDGTIVQRAR